MTARLPLVVILGATGTGKTKLSIQLARRFKGEIISSDSMQMYKGLDIVTAKATKEEQGLTPHHMINIFEPHEVLTVVEYRNKALKIIDNLLSQNTIPIVVGGTNYYMEALLWKILIEEPGGHVKILPDIVNKDHELPSEELHRKLKLLDPNMARRLHPRNKRKILRSLEVLSQKGLPHSKILEEQVKSQGASQTGGGLRYQNALIFRLECEKTVLDERLNNRVDKMMKEGLVQELTDFHKKYNESRLNNTEIPDYTKGVFQSIGFKEFHSFLVMSEEERKSEKGQAELKNSIEQLKMVTRRYARKQDKWTTNRFLRRHDREVPPMYGLDVTDVDNWDENVERLASEIVESFIMQKACKYQPLKMQASATRSNAEDDSFFCDICERVFVGEFQWKEHLNSNRHKRIKDSKRKLEKVQPLLT